MNKEFSTQQLLMLALVAIALSAFSIIFSLDQFHMTGFASTDVGFVNVTVPSSASLTVQTKAINFTSTLPGETRNSYLEADVDTTDGRLCTSNNHCGMNITNDGTSFINITILETENLFDSGSFSANSHFLYNVTMQDDNYAVAYGANSNCSVGYDAGPAGVGGVGYWRGVPRSTSEPAVCYLNYTDTPPGAGDSDSRPDIARIEFNITVPLDEGAGDKAGTITFTAVAS